MVQTLNFDTANAGLDLIAFRELTSRPEDDLEVLVFRLLERLLDQLDHQGREATESEDTLFRYAISAFKARSWDKAVAYAWRAARIGNNAMTPGITDKDRSLSLREALVAARESWRQ